MSAVTLFCEAILCLCGGWLLADGYGERNWWRFALGALLVATGCFIGSVR